jgi:hypothetical protein
VLMASAPLFTNLMGDLKFNPKIIFQYPVI